MNSKEKLMDVEKEIRRLKDNIKVIENKSRIVAADYDRIYEIQKEIKTLSE